MQILGSQLSGGQKRKAALPHLPPHGLRCGEGTSLGSEPGPRQRLSTRIVLRAVAQDRARSGIALRSGQLESQ